MRRGKVQRLGAVAILIVGIFLMAYFLYSRQSAFSMEALLWITVAVATGLAVGLLSIWAVKYRRRPAPTQAAVPGGLEGMPGRPRKEYVVPADLPPPPTVLLGRNTQIEQICRVLQQPRNGPKTVVLSGPTGIGRSALAVSVADLLADCYPDGQVLIDADSRADMRAEDVFAAFYWALKGPGDERPAPADLERWYRDRTAKKRILVILDNFSHLKEIRRFLPSGERCALIVASTAPIPGLVADVSLTLCPLDEQSARGTLLALLGRDDPPPGPETDALRAIVAATARYPVALYLAGAALTGRRNWTLQLAVQRMAEVAALRAPDTDGLPAFVGALDLSFAMLTHRERCGLALLGLLPGATGRVDNVASWMLAALLRGLRPPEQRDPGTREDLDSGPEFAAAARRLLDRFAHARLAQQRFDDVSGVVTYQVPEYVRAYARAHLRTLISPEERAAAERMLDEEQARRGRRKPDDLLSGTVYQMLDEGRLAAALDAARDAVAHSHALRGRGQSPAMAREGLSLAALAEVYAELGWIEEGMTCAELALHVGDDSGAGQPRAHRVLGQLRSRQRLFARALDEFDRAATAARRIDDDKEQIRVLRERTATHALAGQPALAVADANQALSLCVRVGAAGDRLRPGVLWAHAGALLAWGQLEQAVGVLREAEELTRIGRRDQRLWRPWIRHQRALVALAGGRYEEGRKYGFRALDDFTEIRHRYGAGHSRLAIGRAFLAEGRIDAAVPMLEETLTTFRASGDRWIEAEAATVLAEAQQRAYQLQPSAQAPPITRQLLLAAEQTFARLGDTTSEGRSRRMLADLDEIQVTIEREPTPSMPVAHRRSTIADLVAPLGAARRIQS